MARSTSYGEAVDLIIEALRGLEMEPRLIPHGKIDELRGGHYCFQLGAGEGVDAAILLVRPGSRPLLLGASQENLYRVDYAVRGNIRGVLPGRILARTVLERRGVLRRVAGVRWEIPQARRGAGRPYLRIWGMPSGPGELWEGGVHQRLMEKLNGDAELMMSLRKFLEGRRGPSMTLSIVTDGWGESIRICGSLWLRTRDLPDAYINPAYLEITNRIGRDIKEVRRSFGGLTF